MIITGSDRSEVFERERERREGFLLFRVFATRSERQEETSGEVDHRPEVWGGL